MTLLVGILCTNGIVIAADRQAMHGTAGSPTVAQPATKVTPIDGKALFATSGHVGLGQQLTAVIEKRLKEFGNHKYHAAIKHVQKDFRDIIDPALKTAGFAAQVYGPQAAASDATCGGLLAAGFSDGFKLVEITPQVGFEHATEDLSFISMGSGKFSADTFLGFLKDAFGPDKLPNIAEGALVAYWTVSHAIKMKVPGVGGEPDVFVLEPGKEGYVARQYEEAELIDHQEFIEEAENKLSSMADAFKKTATGKPPPTKE